MCVLTRRLQILLDEDRYSRLAAEAARTNLSVAAVIRNAIDSALPSEEDERERAAEAILSASQLALPDPEALKAELEEIRTGRP
jgi:hypothetical protein